MLHARQQLPDPDRPHASRPAQAAAAREERRPGVDDDVRTVGQRCAAARRGSWRHGDAEREVHVGVPQGQVDACPCPGRRMSCTTWPSTHTGAFRDVLGDLGGEQPDRPRLLRRVCRRRRRPRASSGATLAPGPWPPTVRSRSALRTAVERATGARPTWRRDPAPGSAARRLARSRRRASGCCCAAPRGYCAGVDRAVVAVEKALDLYGAPVYVRKQIVHNKHVVATLESAARSSSTRPTRCRRAPPSSSPRTASPRPSTRRPRAPPEDDRRDLPAGDEGPPRGHAVRAERLRHPPHRPRGARGGRGHRRRGARNITLVDGPGRRRRRTVRDPERVVWLSQTTLSVDETMETVRRLRERFPKLQDPPSDDICYATQNRQVAIKKIAAEADLVIVVGSATPPTRSGSSRWRSSTAPGAAHRVDYADEIDEAWLDGVATVGVTSGASACRRSWSARCSPGSPSVATAPVEEVVAAEETCSSRCPKELRRDLKAAAGPPGRRGADAAADGRRARAGPADVSRRRRRPELGGPSSAARPRSSGGASTRRPRRFELAVDHAEVRHPPGGDEHPPLERPDQRVVVLDRALQRPPELAMPAPSVPSRA